MWCIENTIIWHGNKTFVFCVKMFARNRCTFIYAIVMRDDAIKLHWNCSFAEECRFYLTCMSLGSCFAKCKTGQLKLFLPYKITMYTYRFQRLAKDSIVLLSIRSSSLCALWFAVSICPGKLRFPGRCGNHTKWSHGHRRILFHNVTASHDDVIKWKH